VKKLIKHRKARSVWVVECDNGNGWTTYDAFLTLKEAERKVQSEDDGTDRVIWRVVRYEATR
jgi:hypothetical protein